MKKKILSLALALVMVLTLFPVTVSAAYDNYERNLKQYNESPVKPKVLEMLSNMEFEYIDEIVDLARSIVEGISSDYDKAKAIHYWVAENIWYGGPVGDVLYSSLAHVLKYRRGVCGHYADLTLALLRASGIPALHVVGAINSITDVGHSWVEAYADNRWIIMDPTWDSQNRYENHPEKRSARGVYFDISLEEISKSHLMGAYWDRDNEVFNPYYISLRNEFVVDVKIHKGSIGDYTFSGYTNLSTVTIGNGVTHIGEGAFTGLSITSIVVPGSVKQIDRAAFSVCENLETVTIQDGVTSIGNSMFLACTSLTSVSLPNSLKSIEDYAFARSSLSHIVIPDGVTSIGDLAFSNCDNLTSVVIPESVTNIGGHVFHITIWSDGAYTIYPIPGLTIYGKAGSYAETYAKDNNIPFKVGFPPNPIDTASSWAREGITAAIGKGFVPNQLQTKYTNVITRAEFCRMAVKWVEYALGKPIAEVVAERGDSLRILGSAA